MNEGGGSRAGARASSPFGSRLNEVRYFPSAACAAASRAIGTRNGEQLT
jgi:hypothetical protein